MAENEANTSKLCHGEERYAQLVVPGRNSSVALQLTEEALDEISLSVKPRTEDDRSLSVGFRWDVRPRTPGSQLCS